MEMRLLNRIKNSRYDLLPEINCVFAIVFIYISRWFATLKIKLTIIPLRYLYILIL